MKKKKLLFGIIAVIILAAVMYAARNRELTFEQLSKRIENPYSHEQEECTLERMLKVASNPHECMIVFRSTRDGSKLQKDTVAKMLDFNETSAEDWKKVLDEFPGVDLEVVLIILDKIAEIENRL